MLINNLKFESKQYRQFILNLSQYFSSSTQRSSSVSVMTSSNKHELDLDVVERAAMLTHPTASRAKAPRRRPPSTVAKDVITV